MGNFFYGLTELSMLASAASSGSEILNEAYGTFKTVVSTILPILIGVVLVLGMFFGISLGIKFAKAEDTEARDKAKGQLINLAIGIGVAAVILLVAHTLVVNDVFANSFRMDDSASAIKMLLMR